MSNGESNYFYYRDVNEVPEGFFSLNELCEKFCITKNRLNYLIQTRRLYTERVRIKTTNTFFYPERMIKEVLFEA